MQTPIRFGVLLLSHMAHVHHCAPVAFELSMDERFEVTLFTSTTNNLKLVEDMVPSYPGNRCNIQFLKPALWYRIIKSYKNRPYPRVRHILKTYYNIFDKQDIIITPHDNVHYLMNRENGSRRKRYISTLHGMEDGERANLKTRYKGFDFLIVSGEKRMQHLIQKGVIAPENAKVVGYPKFDIVLKKEKTSLRLFNNENPVVIYNPHYNPEVTSWNKWGRKILDYFLENTQINLIFAPHVKLFHKKKKYFLRKYEGVPNIHMDVDSPNLVDMTYVPLSDIYMGDVSSQVFEFIYHPKPCVFLNTNQFDWKKMSALDFWHLGEVIDDLSHLPQAISEAPAKHPFYSDLQKRFIADRVSISEIPAGRRGAQAIVDFTLGINAT